MIVVLASRFDASAARLVERWRERGARLVTPEGLSVPGWNHESHGPERSTAVLEGEVVAIQSIRAVLTRLSAVSEEELPHIESGERAYVASEMTAFLLAWLASLTCPVLNRPTPTCLSGPSWGHEEWVHRAAKVGFSIRPVHRVARRLTAKNELVTSTAPASPEDFVHVASVGDRVFGDAVDGDIAQKIRRLAEATNVELLTTTFSRAEGCWTYVRTSPWIDVDRAELSDAVLRRMESAP